MEGNDGLALVVLVDDVEYRAARLIQGELRLVGNIHALSLPAAHGQRRMRAFLAPCRAVVCRYGRRRVAPMSAVQEWARQRKSRFLALLVGAVLGTILWFVLSPFLDDEQESMVSWLLMGANLAVVGVSLLVQRARRQTNRAL